MSSDRFGPVLVGLRGSGKSSVAPLLADALQMDWIDADLELERREGCSIAELFAQRGEAAFRAREATLLIELLARERVVLATGGGAVLHTPVRQALRQRMTIWLDAPVEALASRIAGSDRPPLTEHADAHRQISEVARIRTPLYRQVAGLRIDTAATDLAQTVAAIVEFIGARSEPRD